MQSPKVRNGASLGTRIGGACNHEFLATHVWPPKVQVQAAQALPGQACLQVPAHAQAQGAQARGAQVHAEVLSGTFP